MPYEHGTISRYTNKGCRCDLCRAAKSAYRESRRLLKRRLSVVCDTCGCTFEASNPKQKRCQAPNCQRKYWRDKTRRRSSAAWGLVNCATCGDVFDTGPIKSGPPPKHCAPCKKHGKRWLDRQRYQPATPKQKQCNLCGAKFVAQGTRVYCSDQCSALGKSIAWRKLRRQRLLAGLCARHGTPGQCEICHSRNFNKANKRRGPEGARGPTQSKVDRNKLCEQQKWKCSLCGKKLNPELRGTHDMAISIDHVIPVSMGGTHDLPNLAVAHRICNSRKGNRSLGPEQLRMIG